MIAAETPLLAAEGLTKLYGPRVGCIDVALAVHEGEVLAVVGESGSGKSTLSLKDSGQPAGTPVWESAGEGWYFLGPPLPVHDRLYAIARLAAVKVWWVSDQVAPDLGGSWRALIHASAKPGQEITVSAVRIPAQVYLAPTAMPGATPGPPPTPAQIRTDLRANGSGSRWVEGESPPVAVRGPAG